MSNFRTVLPLEKSTLDINYQSSILCIGSCFTENIGNLLVANKFPILLNPFGILYNPISIKSSLEILLSEKKYTTSDLFLHQDLWRSFDHHSFFSTTNQAQALRTINDQLETARRFLKQTKWLFLTFGTANTFINKSTGKVVVNCHKLPNTNFEKRLSLIHI